MDTVANLLTSLMNAQRVKKEHVAVPYSRHAADIARLLQTKGFVAKVREQAEPKQRLMITLAYDAAAGSRIHGLRRLSKPGQRRYVASTEIPYSYDGMGMIVLSTSQGIMDGVTARKKGVGGELVCEIW